MKARFIRRSLYSLKRRYGTSLDLYHIVGIDHDVKTGKKTVSKIKYHVRRGIILPTLLRNEFLNSRASAKTDARPTAQTGTTLIVIDNKDLPKDFEITKNDYIVIRHRRYDIKSTDDFEHGHGMLLTTIKLEGSQANEIFEVKMIQTLSLVQTIEND